MSPGGRKQVVVAGIEDNSSSSSSGDEDKPSGSGDSAAEEPEDREVDEEEVWVKRPEVSRPKEADVPVTGVVVAKPSLCQNYPGAAN